MCQKNIFTVRICVQSVCVFMFEIHPLIVIYRQSFSIFYIKEYLLCFVSVSNNSNQIDVQTKQ